MTPTPRQHHPLRKSLFTAAKILIAVVGLWYVIAHISWADRVVLPAGLPLRNVTLTRPATLPIARWQGHMPLASFRHQILYVRLASGRMIHGYADRWPLYFPALLPIPLKFMAAHGHRVLVRRGLHDLLSHARPWPLLGAFLLLGLPFVITAWRWRLLMGVQGMHLPYRRCLELTFVGQFYSTFLPGTTSGDVVKIIYTGRVTGQKTRSAVTVLLDRVIGLIGLVLVGGIAAAVQLALSHNSSATGGHPNPGADPVLRNVLLLTGGILLAAAVGAAVYLSDRMRRATGLEWLIDKLPLPEFVKHAERNLRAYRGHLGVIAAALGASVVSQAVLPFAGFLAGRAFGMHAPLGCFMAYIPVAALAASLPIVPPQGIGVMDAILLHFFVSRGVDTASQAFALAQAIRFLPICWNMLGAYWVVRGHYGRPHSGDLDTVSDEPPTPQASHA